MRATYFLPPVGHLSFANGYRKGIRMGLLIGSGLGVGFMSLIILFVL